MSEQHKYVPGNGELDEATAAIGIGLNVLFVGPTGSGKTHLASHVCDTVGKTMYTIQGSDGAAYEHIVGYRDVNVKDGASVTEWVDGILPRAMREGAVLYIDEPNALPDGIRFLCFSAMDHRREITLPECDGGEVVVAAPGFTVIAAMNEGHGYGGTTSLSHAFRDRFDAVIDVDYLEAGLESKLVSDVTGVDPKVAERIVRVGGMLRSAAVDKGVKTPVSTRTLLAWGRLIKDGNLDANRAAEVTLVGKVPASRKNERSTFSDVIETVFG